MILGIRGRSLAVGWTGRPGGWLLVAFHIDSPGFAAGEVNHLTSWFGKAVELDGYFLEPADVVSDVEAAGFAVTATMIRPPRPDIEYPSRRCYLLAQLSTCSPGTRALRTRQSATSCAPRGRSP